MTSFNKLQKQFIEGLFLRDIPKYSLFFIAIVWNQQQRNLWNWEQLSRLVIWWNLSLKTLLPMKIDQRQWPIYIPCLLVSLKCFEIKYVCVDVPQWHTHTNCSIRIKTFIFNNTYFRMPETWTCPISRTKWYRNN